MSARMYRLKGGTIVAEGNALGRFGKNALALKKGIPASPSCRPFRMPFQGARGLYRRSEGVALGYYGVAFQAVTAACFLEGSNGQWAARWAARPWGHRST